MELKGSSSYYQNLSFNHNLVKENSYLINFYGRLTKQIDIGFVKNDRFKFLQITYLTTFCFLSCTCQQVLQITLNLNVGTKCMSNIWTSVNFKRSKQALLLQWFWQKFGNSHLLNLLVHSKWKNILWEILHWNFHQYFQCLPLSFAQKWQFLVSPKVANKQTKF